jgi:hypothetical protein
MIASASWPSAICCATSIPSASAKSILPALISASGSEVGERAVDPRVYRVRHEVEHQRRVHGMTRRRHGGRSTRPAAAEQSGSEQRNDEARQARHRQA